MTYQIHVGDCIEAMRAMPDNSVDAIVTDPPYGLTSARPSGRSKATEGAVMKGFMGLAWDGDVPSVEIWSECLRVLKPGGHLLAFAGTRTQHRMAVRIEDAGFEIRDMIAWVYGSGFPKSHNGEWGGTALKPALEPITMARKPLAGTVAANWAEHGTGALNIDACRVPIDKDADASQIRTMNRSVREVGDGWGMSTVSGDTPSVVRPDGRWPANVIHDGSDEVVGAFPETKSGGYPPEGGQRSQVSTYGKPTARGEQKFTSSEGSAARFFCQSGFEDEEWLEAQFPALIAGSPLCLQRLADCIAQSDAAISVLPEGNLLSVARAPSTNVTPTQSRQIASCAITAIQHIANGSWQGLQREKHFQSPSPVSVAASLTPTGTMTITLSHSELDGYAGSITFSITQTSLEVGAKGSELSPGNRFIYCAKASRKDRNEGVGSSDTPAGGTGATMREREDADWPARNGNHHPTVKPTDLMRYLVRLVTPPGGTVLDPFMGSGSTGKAAVLEGFRFIGCELSAEYSAIAKARIEHEVRKLAPATEAQRPGETLPLFESEAA